MPSIARSCRAVTLYPVLTLLAVACGGGTDLVLPGEGEPAKLEVVEGNGQSGRVTDSLPGPVVARVQDSDGRPVVGVPVTFAVTDGGEGTEAVPDTVVSGADGLASFRIVLGTRVGPGTGELRAVTAGGASTLTELVSFTALPADASGMALVSGEGQSAPINSGLPQPLVVGVTDAFGNPIPGVRIDWSASGGGSVSATTTVTDESGRASVTRVLGGAVGSETTIASAEGLAGSPVTFHHTVLPGNAARVAVVSGDGQSAVVGTRLPQDLVVQVLDAVGNPVPGRAVTWVVLTGGGTADPINTTTDDQGHASTRLTLGPEPGPNTVTAVVSGIGVASFTATGTPDPRTIPARVEQSGGDGQTGTVGTTLARPLAVKVTSADGTPVAGVTVAWAAVGGGSVTAPTSTTGPDGIAQVFRTLGDTPGTYGTTATVAGLAGSPVGFSASATAGAPSRLALILQPSPQAVYGTPFARQPVVQLHDAAGGDLRQAGVSVTAGVAAGGGRLIGTVTVRTGPGGQAVFTDLALQGAPGTYTLIFSAAGFTAALSEPIALQDAATVTTVTADDPDPSDSAQAVAVRFRVASQAGVPGGIVTVTAGTATCSAALRNGEGQCTLVLDVPGTVTITASYPGAPGFAPSSATATHTVRSPAPPPPPTPSATVTTISGDDPDPSTPGEAVTVRFTVTSDGGTPTGAVTVSASTGESCSASVADGQCVISFAAPGDRTLTAQYAGNAQFAASSGTATHTVRTPPPPVSVPTTTTITGDDPDPSAPGQSVTMRFTVTAASGTPTGSVTVSASPTESCSGTVAEGQCAITLTSPGDRTLTATYGGEGLFEASSDTEAHTVNALPPPPPAATTTTITADTPDPSAVGQAVAVRFAVTSGAGTPDGSVTVNASTGESCSASVADGQCVIAFSTAGSTILTATYGGSAQFAGSSATEAHTVNPAPPEPTTTTIVEDAPDPSNVGQPVTVRFTVTSAAGAPAGDVTVSAGPGESCTASVADGQCTLTLTTAGDRTLTASYVGSAAFGASSDAEAHVVVVPNAPPAAADDQYTVDEGGTLSLPAPGVLANDSDPDGNALTAALGVAPSHGTVTLNADGSFTYTPAAGFSGLDAFAYTASDGSATSGPATVAITVNEVDAPPAAVGDAYQVDEDATLEAGAGSGVLANDTDPEGDALSAVAAGGATHGSLTLNGDGSFSYRPDADYGGTDQFTYRASDGRLQSAATVTTITVNPVNDAPSFRFADGGQVEARAGEAVVRDQWLRDISPGPPDEAGQSLTFLVTTDNDALFSAPPTISSDGTLTFTAAPNAAPAQATVTVTLRDNGGTDRGGRDTSAAETFVIEVKSS